MTNKTLINVKLPATGKGYDFWVPDDMCMQDVSQLVCQAMQNIEPDFFCCTGDQSLMYERTGQIQNPAATVGEIGFADGDAFVLV